MPMETWKASIAFESYQLRSISQTSRTNSVYSQLSFNRGGHEDNHSHPSKQLFSSYSKNRHHLNATESFLKLVFVLHATTVSAKRSFVGLRRLKSYIWPSSMSQYRLFQLPFVIFISLRCGAFQSFPVRHLCKKFVYNSNTVETGFDCSLEKRSTFGSYEYTLYAICRIWCIK